jgi:hypothetical protein
MQMYHIFCIHSSVEGHLGSFELLAIINRASMNIVKHVFLLSVGKSSGYMPRGGIPGSSSSPMSNFLRNHQTNFQSGYTCLQSHQQWRSDPLAPHPHQHLLSLEFLILAILIGVRCNLMVVLICISLMIKDVQHFFFRCFSAIQHSSVENSSFSSVPHFNGVYLESSFLSSLCILNVSPLSDLGLAKIISLSVCGLFVLLTVSFALHKLCNIMRSHLLILDLKEQAVGILFRNFSLVTITLRLLPTFSSISFSVSGFMWSSFIHLDFRFVQGDENRTIHILLHDNHQLCQHHLLKRLSFFFFFFNRWF